MVLSRTRHSLEFFETFEILRSSNSEQQFSLAALTVHGPDPREIQGSKYLFSTHRVLFAVLERVRQFLSASPVQSASRHGIGDGRFGRPLLPGFHILEPSLKYLEFIQ